jgi:hypothetical protein
MRTLAGPAPVAHRDPDVPWAFLSARLPHRLVRRVKGVALRQAMTMEHFVTEAMREHLRRARPRPGA